MAQTQTKTSISALFCDLNNLNRHFDIKTSLLPIDVIVPNRYQPRKSFDSASLLRLADSIRRYGLLQPITVRAINNSNADKPACYEIICGERRYRASILAGLSFIPCNILSSDDLNAAEMSIIENLLRDDLNIFEQAEAFNTLIVTFKLTQEEVAAKISMSQSAVANKLRLLKFSPEEREAILSSGLTERHARALLRIDSKHTREKFISIIAKDKLNVAATEALIDNYLEYTKRTQAEKSNKNSATARQSTGIVKDLRLLTNTIEKAAATLRNSGIKVEISTIELNEFYEYSIRVFKRNSV